MLTVRYSLDPDDFEISRNALCFKSLTEISKLIFETKSLKIPKLAKVDFTAIIEPKMTNLGPILIDLVLRRFEWELFETLRTQQFTSIYSCRLY